MNWRSLVVAVYIMLVVPLIIASAYSLNSLAQKRTQNEASSQLSRELARSVGEIQSLMSALAGMHYANQSEREGAFIAFAQQLRTRNPMIAAIGRYRNLAPDDREQFEHEMSARGLYNYRVVDLGKSGDRLPAPPRTNALPVSHIEPMTAELLGLLGADLAAEPELISELEAISAEHRDTLITVPEHWPAAGQLILFRPVYQGIHIPTSVDERQAQAHGGYWMIIDPEALPGGFEQALGGYTRTLDLQSPLGLQRVVEHHASEQNNSLLTSLFAPRTTQQFFKIGNSHLKLSLTAQVGILPIYLIATLALLTLLTLSLALALAYSRHRERAQHEREASRETLLSEREKASRTLDAIADAVLSFDADGRILHVNPSATELLSAPANELKGADLDTYLTLYHLDAKRSPFDPLLALTQLGASHRLDVDLTPDEYDDENNDICILRTSLSAAGEDHTTGILVLRDTSAESKLHKALEHQANHDALTGCTNRYHFERHLEHLVEGKRSGDANHALLYMDLDQFKVVNDTAGHSAGDRLLVELTQNLQKICRHGDILSRIGGDEFGLIMSDVTAEEALAVTQKIYELFQTLVFTDSGRAFPVRASLGLVHFDEASDSVAEVLAAADLACYAAKELGRNEVFVYRADDETITNRSNELNWLPHLKRALDDDLFRLHAQPLADVKTGRISHFEFLLRLTDDEGRETSPWRIIQAAERYGLMKDIDRWIISHAMGMIASLEGPHADMKFAINLSGQSAADAGLIDFIKQEFLEHRVDPARLCFELTETAAITNFATAVELANSIRELGSRMALDDFGSGLSSFGYLKNLPVDVLKIDGQFIKDIANNDVDRAMVKAINDVAVSMQLTTVAEFVEDEKILAVLQEIGIDLAQGYFIGKPMALDAALEHVNNRNLEANKQDKAA